MGVRLYNLSIVKTGSKHMEKWYKGVYRRNLVDMHINDTSEEYFSKFSAEEYFDYLKRAGIQGPMIYIQSHTGLCNFPTKVSKTHEFFKKHPDELKKLISLCKEDGMKVVGYYSLIFNNQAVYDHPEWEMRNADGSTWREHGQRYGLCCPNNREYRDFVVEQIKEIAKEYHDLDGIFFDMPYWEVACHCPSCEEEWKKLSDHPMPEKLNWDDADWRLYAKARQDQMVDFVRFVREKSNELLPGVTVEFNFAAVVGCDWLSGSTEGINEECEFTGGDLYGDLYNHSFTAKYYYGITKNQPFEYMTCRCNKNLREHTINKNESTLEAEIMLTCMHHGASLIIDAINPDGSLDKRVADRLGRVFEMQKPYEKHMDKGEMLGEVAVYFDSKTMYNYHGRPYNKQCAVNTVRTLIENHIPVRVISNGSMRDLSSYKMIIAPALNEFDNPEPLKLIDYVREGGNLYLSGNSDPRLLKEFFGAEIVGETNGESPFQRVYKGYDEVQAYVYPTSEKTKKIFGEFNEKYPLPSIYKLPIISATKGDVVAKICLPYTDPDDRNHFASIHSNPPGPLTQMPAMLEVEYGMGRVFYSAHTIEADPRYNYKDVFMGIVKEYVDPTFKVDASRYVECVVFKTDDGYYLNLFDLNSNEDVVDRKFEITCPSSFTVEVIGKPGVVETEDEIIRGTFSKYLSLKLSK